MRTISGHWNKLSLLTTCYPSCACTLYQAASKMAELRKTGAEFIFIFGFSIEFSPCLWSFIKSNHVQQTLAYASLNVPEFRAV